LTRIKARQKSLSAQRDAALSALRREPELITANPITFLAHALVIPSSNPDDLKHRDDQIEALAMQVAMAYEQANGAVVKDVSTKEQAYAAGLGEYPGFDLYSRRPKAEERAIEVKGRARVGDVDISENEWAKACNLRERYWLYVVYDCATPNPRLLRIQNPWKLVISGRGARVGEHELFIAAEPGD